MDLRTKRDGILAEARAILDAAKSAERGMSAEETATFDAKVAEADGLTATMERDAKLEADTVSSRAKLPAHQMEPDPKPVSFQTVERKREPGECLGVIVRALHNHKGDKINAVAQAERTYGGSSPEFRALGASDFTAGGALVPDEFSSEIIPLLLAESVFRKAGAVVLPLRGTLEIPKMTGGVTGYWVGENAAITPSEGTFGSVKLIEKKLAAVTPISNDLLRLGGASVDRLIRDNIVTSLANTEDQAFFKGTGTAYSPRGIYYQMASAHNTATAGTSLANFRTDIQDCLTFLDDDNVPRVRRAWFYPTSTVTYMKWSLVDGNSNFSFPELRASNTIDGFPVYVSNNLASDMYHVEMSKIYIGDGPGLEIQVRDGAAWDNSGTVVAGYSYDQSVIRAIKVTDMVMADPNAASCQNTLTV
jgi:HK97 family phage major capsid protein